MKIKNGFVSSSDVKVFPCAYRGTDDKQNIYNPEAKLNTESSFVSKGTNVSDLVQSYILDWTNEKLTCVIAGYKFEINDLKVETLTTEFPGQDVYIKIKLNSLKILNTDTTKVLGNINDPASNDLDNQLNTGNVERYFTGLQLIGCAPNTTTGLIADAEEAYTLRILTAKGNKDNINFLPKIAKGVGNNSIILNTDKVNPQTNESGNLATIAERAIGDNSVAEGEGTKATGKASHAGGKESVANADYSATFGTGTTTDIQNQITIGTFNEKATDALVIVGNGTSNSDRKNAVEIKASDGKVVTNAGIENTGMITSTGNTALTGTFKNTGTGEFTNTLTTNGITNTGTITSTGNTNLTGSLVNTGTGEFTDTLTTNGITNNTNNITNTGNYSTTNGNITTTNGKIAAKTLKVTSTTETTGITNTGTITSTDNISTDKNISAEAGKVSAKTLAVSDLAKVNVIDIKGKKTDAESNDKTFDYILIDNHRLIYTTIDIKPYTGSCARWGTDSFSWPGNLTLGTIPIIRERNSIEDSDSPYEYDIDFNWGKSYESKADWGGYGAEAIGIITGSDPNYSRGFVDSISAIYKGYNDASTHGRIFAGHLHIWLPAAKDEWSNIPGKVYGYVLRQKNITEVEFEPIYGTIPNTAHNIVFGAPYISIPLENEILYSCTISNLAKLGTYHSDSTHPYN